MMPTCGSDMTKPAKGCKESDGKHNRNHTDNKDKYFFQILVGNFQKRLTIPNKFVQHLYGRPQGTFTLESQSGYTFDVKLTNKSGKLVFQTGWNAFATAHDLKMGDILVFKYDGFSQFRVLIFDPSCCEKVLPCPLEKNDGETIEISSSSVQAPLKSPSDIRSSSSPSDSTGYFPSSGDRKSHAVPRYIHSKRITLTGVQEKKLNDKVRAISSSIPIYVCVMRKSNISGKKRSMDISREYAEEYLRFEDQTVLLCRNGKRWEVRCSVQNWGQIRYKRLLKGWNRFAEDNHLQLGDLCLFELVQKKKYVMNVHVIHEK